MQRSKIISKKVVFQSKFFQVNHVLVKKNGKEFVKDIVKRNPSVYILPLIENNELYLVYQYRDALRNFSLEVVAGMTTETENPLKAAKRELQEETGLTAKKWRKITTMNISANIDSTAHIFLAQELEKGASNPDEDEEIELVKISLEEAVEKVMNGEIVNSPSVASILLLDKLLMKGRVP